MVTNAIVSDHIRPETIVLIPAWLTKALIVFAERNDAFLIQFAVFISSSHGRIENLKNSKKCHVEAEQRPVLWRSRQKPLSANCKKHSDRMNSYNGGITGMPLATMAIVIALFGALWPLMQSLE